MLKMNLSFGREILLFFCSCRMSYILTSSIFHARDVVRIGTAIKFVNLSFYGRNALFLIND